MTFEWECSQQASDEFPFFNSRYINHNEYCSLFFDYGSVNIEGPMSWMTPLELTVSKAAGKVHHIKFYCKGDGVNQDLTVSNYNVSIENVDL